MNTQTSTRRPENIEADIERTRAELNDTLSALQSRLSPGQLFDQALRYLRQSGGGDSFVHNLTDTVKHNPMPTALIGVGLAWLMMADSGYPPRRSTVSSYPERPQPPAPGAYVHTDTEQAPPVYPEARSEPGAVGSSAGYSGSSWDARESARKARDSVAGAAHGVGETLSDTAHSVRHGMERAAAGAREQSARLSAQARYGYEMSEHYFNRLLQEQPLVLGAVGVALGAALGSGLPPTRREDELMGGTRDELLTEAKAAAKEQAARAQRLAQSAAGAATEQAKREGLTGEGVKEQMREAQAKAQRVAEAARDAAKDEAQRQGMSKPIKDTDTSSDPV